MSLNPLALYDRLLRERGDLGERLKDSREASRVALAALLAAALLGAFYGFVMGAYSMMHGGEPAFAWSSMWKVPVLMVGATVLTFPVLYVLGLLGGATLSAASLSAALCCTLAVVALALGVMGPIVLFFISTVDAYVLVKFLHVAVWSFAGLAGLKFLRTLLRSLDPALTGNGRLMAGWMLLFGLVGMQGGWMLRPFIGHPKEQYQHFRQLGGNVFEDLARDLWRMSRGPVQENSNRSQDDR